MIRGDKLNDEYTTYQSFKLRLTSMLTLILLALILPGVHLFSLLDVKTSYAKRSQVSLRLTDSLITDFRDDNRNGDELDDNYQLAINRLNVTGEVYGVTLVSRLDTMYFHDAPTDDFQTTWARLERLQLKKRWKLARRSRLTLQVGDFYHRLGEGMILSLIRSDEFAFDVALRGAKASWRYHKFETQMFGGVSNVVNIDMVSMHHIEDRRDLILGGESKYNLPRAKVGVLYAYIEPEEQEISDLVLHDATSSGGLYLDSKNLSFLNLYLEFDVQQRRLAESIQEGKAVYTRFDFHFHNTTILSDWLWLDNFEQRGSQNTAVNSRFNYNLGPNLERIDQEVAELYDVRGTRLRLEQGLLKETLSLHLNGLYRLTKPDDPMEITQYHGFGGLDWKYDQKGSKISMSGGHRLDLREGYISRVWSHAEGGAEYNWGFLTTYLKSQFQRIQVEQQPFFIRGSNVFGIDKSGLGSISVEWGVDTMNRSAGVRQQFLAGIFEYVLNNFISIQGVLGNQRGGIKCIAGVCRDFPEFSGYRIQVIASHNLKF